MKTDKLQTALVQWQGIQPISDTDKMRLSRKFTVDFNYNSNHIEGNTLTYGQTELLLLFGKVIGQADFFQEECRQVTLYTQDNTKLDQTVL